MDSLQVDRKDWGEPLLQTTRKAIDQFLEDDCLTLSASLAFYTLFALPPLLYLLAIVISSGISGLFPEREARERTQAFLQSQAGQLIGDYAAAAEVGKMLENVGERNGSTWRSLLSLAGVLVGATGLMESLQTSLNRVWKVKPTSKAFYARFVLKRLFSLAMILGFGFVLLVSLAVSTLLTILSNYAANRLGLGGMLPSLFNHGLTFITGWIFFIGIFKFMPDAQISLKNAVMGGLFTVVLFTFGRIGLFVYFQVAAPTAQLGTAAGAVAILLLWVYYSTVILMFGAEFMVASTRLQGERVVPEKSASTVTEKISPAQ